MDSTTLTIRLRHWVLALLIVVVSPTLGRAQNPFLPEPIFDTFLAPMFATCTCPVYGVQDAVTWEDRTDPSMKYYQTNVVLGLNREARVYLFRINGNGLPTIEAISEPDTWPTEAKPAY